MTRYVALLRGINLGRRNVKMERLRETFEGMGYADVATYIASGNVIFAAKDADLVRLAPAIEAGLRDALGYEVTTILRTGPEMVAVAGHEPFPDVAGADTLPLNVAFLREQASPDLRAAMLALRTPDDEFHVHGSEIYWLARGGIGRSAAARGFEKALAGQGTVRNMSTVRKIADRYFST